MQKELEKKINDVSNGREIRLHGIIKLNIEQSGAFTVGRLCVKGIIQIMRSDIIIDGSDAEFEVNIMDCTTSDWSLFFIHPTARNVQFRNMQIKVRIQNSVASTRMFSFIYNTAFGMKMHNCQIDMCSEKQLNLVGVYNNGNLDTHMETRADNLVIENCLLKIECCANEFGKECNVYGLYNNLANSICVQNTFIYSTNKGNGKLQRAIGIYTNGRFGRFVGNNIKANASHNVGREKEQAYAYGFINEGLYTIIASNNIVGEWGGMCIGLENRGEYIVISGNKILSTHTICGRSIRNYGNNTSIEGNILTSTSRNARLIEHRAHNCVIVHNIMEILMAQSECRSGCGVYSIGQNCTGNIISENMIRNVTDCGLFVDESIGIVKDNYVEAYQNTIKQASPNNKTLAIKLDECNIQSIYQN